MHGKKIDVLPSQLPLFSEAELAACTSATLGACPWCRSAHVYVRYRWRKRAVLCCGQCRGEWGKPWGPSPGLKA
jgi:hypothetical protein